MKKFAAIMMLILFCSPVLALAPGLTSYGHQNAEAILLTELADAQADTGSIHVPVCEDGSIINGSYADENLEYGYMNTLYVGVAPDVGWIAARSWLKFNLSTLPSGVEVVNATLNVFLDMTAFSDDLPMGVFNSANDSWTDATITWNTAPDMALSPTDVIDSPASPDMFVAGRWYQWDITSDFHSDLVDDGILTEVLGLVDESEPTPVFYYFAESRSPVQDHVPYVSLEYSFPEATNPKVDGQSTSPRIDYIQDSTPSLSWTFSDDDMDDYQRGYEVEVWNNTHYNETLLFRECHNEVVEVYHSTGALNARPFATAAEFRFQFKYSSALLTRSGTIDKLHFQVNEAYGTAIFENLEVTLANCELGTDLTIDFNANYGGADRVVVLESEEYHAVIENHSLIIDVANTFVLSQNSNLMIELRFMNNTGTLAWSNITMGIGGSAAYSWGPGAYTDLAADTIDNRGYGLEIEFASEEVFYSDTSSGNFYPFATDVDEWGWFQTKYNSSLIGQTGIIDKILFRVDTSAGSVIYENFTVLLVESPREGEMAPDPFENYGGVTPTVVLESSLYEVRNTGRNLVIDIDNIFYYAGTHDLLIELRWDALVSGSAITYRTLDAGGYRAWNVSRGIRYDGNDTRTHDAYLDFIHPETALEYAGVPLTNATRYYWRVRTSDSTGFWSDWTTQSFKYETVTVAPSWEDLVFNPDPAIAGSPVTASITVTHLVGINSVWFEWDGSNYSMAAIGDIYSYTWTPTTAGTIGYVIYMESSVGTWSKLSGDLVVEAATTTTDGVGIDPMLLIAIIGAAGVVIVIIVIIMKRRG